MTHAAGPEDEQYRGSAGGAPPLDAVQPPPQQHPRDAAEAAADRDMAEAEEDVSRHAGTRDEVESVEEMASERGQEDRRRVWMDRHPNADRSR